MNPVKTLGHYGQSIWLDYIRRNLLTGEGLTRLINDDGVKGVTSNPAIFEKAIGGSTDYVSAIEGLADEPTLDIKALYERLAVEDVQRAADILTPIFEATEGRDGYVSLEVSPALANDTVGTIAEAQLLWRAVARDNLMIKVPATPEGIPAIESLLAEGININVTLLFNIKAYEQVAEAYFRGLERCSAAGGDLNKVASVASFFVSRIDTAVDNLLAERLVESEDSADRMLLRSLLGKVAIANAKLTYQRYRELFSGERWQALAKRGAQTQRLLWASTGSKNPAYSDVLYVDELIGPDTVNTVPPATLDAFREHGRPRASLEDDLETAEDVLDSLARVGVSLDEVTDTLLKDGLQLFVDAFDKLLGAVETARTSVAGSLLNRQRYSLPTELERQVQAALEDWRSNDKVRRLWARDASLWTGSDEGQWLDWLDITREQVEHLGKLNGVVQEVEGKFFRHAVLLGMGGSSLAPEVMRLTFGTVENHPELLVLDSTDPAQVKAIEDRIDYARTVFIVSSKSGSTLEPNVLKQYFFTRASEALGAAKAARHFATITDPGSKMQHIAEGDGFRHIFFGKPGIGGRYSALSNFGIVPAGAMGIDLKRFLDQAEEMVEACASCVPAPENPGVVLGAVLAAGHESGRDKITLVASPGIASLGAWLEQLLAESTGKDGKGLIPVDGEQLGPPEVYSNDRLFAYLRLSAAPDPQQDAAVRRLEQAGQPVVRIAVKDVYNLGQEFYRWEIATATAGSILGINAFNQPDVEMSKVATRKLTAEYEATDQLPEEIPFAEEDGLKLYANMSNLTSLRSMVGDTANVGDYLKAHISQLGSGDYFALLVYLERNEAHQSRLQDMRHRVRDSYQVATCLGFGPRFLHSTGQCYKGGPNSGVFLQITCDDANDLAVPDQKYTFGVVKASQARGDFQVLAERGRRVLRIHMGANTQGGLDRLGELLTHISQQTAQGLK